MDNIILFVIILILTITIIILFYSKNLVYKYYVYPEQTSDNKTSTSDYIKDNKQNINNLNQPKDIYIKKSTFYKETDFKPITNDLTNYQDQYHNQFPDVGMYENDKGYKLSDIRLGIDKCYEFCESKGGKCVEFGITGNAWCYPKENIKYNNFTSDLYINNTNPSNESKLIYKNI